ncbi:cation:proton antiporter domain-containing protein [Salarchaeum japonicum]|uniref:Cation:proton antiporter n=1 Tax=Salarchaeum japonicum TaxID=555573 RepID=A0AAV3SZB1_9EURY|nr:cation:proton antiporter [Salarchaeum japonicum]
MSGSEVIPLVAAIIALGVGSQILSDKLQVPSVLFLILAGIVLGPEGAELITPSALGLDALSAIVGLSVAIIVFEGAFHLKWEKLREAPGETLRLVTIGAVIALVGTTAAVHFLLGAAWDLSFLIGALLVATGPTVITPILEVVPVRDRVGAAMETEGVVNDVTAAILAIVVFEVVNPSHASMGLVQSFASRLGAGIAIGALVAGVVWYLLRHVDLSAGGAVQNARLLVLAGALVAYAAANSLFSEAGIAAVATAGMLLGNADLPYEEEIETFKGDITLLVLSFVFIALAALLQFEDLIRLGLGGIGVAVLVAVVIRPLAVFASTFGDRYTVPERAFMSAVGPRGIIPASVATLFAVELQNAGQEAAASTLVGTVFLVILLTVVFEGGPARQFAELLDIIPMRVIIVGGGTVGRALAERLEDRGENVVIIESDESIIEIARNEGFTVHQGDGTDTDVLRKAGAEKAKIMVAATGDDDANLLVSQLADSKFDVETVIARANNPDNVDAFEDLGVRTVSSSMATAWGIDNLIERPALANWMTEIGRSGDVQEIEVTADELAGMTIDELDEKLPNGCIIALVGRGGENEVPERDRALQKGDHLTFLGRKEAVREALDMCHPRDEP